MHVLNMTKLKGRYLLLKAVDPKKDQSYMLYSLSQEQLAHAQFPFRRYDEGRSTRGCRKA